MGKWKNYFQSIEDSAKVYNHGNGAYGSFGYRKTGHLKTLYNSSPELKSKYKSYDDLWGTVTKGNYDSPEVQAIDDQYESWLSKRSNGDLVKAAKFNLSDAKNPANNDIYAKKIASVARLEDGPAPVIKATRLSPVGSNSAQQVNQLVKNTEIQTVPGQTVDNKVRAWNNNAPVTASEWMKPTSPTLPAYQKSTREVRDVRGDEPVPQNKFASVVEGIAPYASNIANLFRKPPMPPKPILDSPVSLQRVNYNNDRYEVERGTRGMDRFAETNSDPQAAFAAKAFNNAQRFTQLSKVNQDERNTNLDIANKETQINTGIAASNRQLQRGYQNDLVQRTLAQQQFQSENLANASDKFMKQQDVSLAREEAKVREDMVKAQDWNAIYGRYLEGKKPRKALDYSRPSEGDSTYKMGGKLPKYTAGNMIRSMNFKRLT